MCRSTVRCVDVVLRIRGIDKRPFIDTATQQRATEQNANDDEQAFDK